MLGKTLIATIALATSLATGPAMAAETTDPAMYLQAFNDTCRRGFPDLDAIEVHAKANGWMPSAIRLIEGSVDSLSAMRVLHKGDLILFLTVPPGSEFKAVCQVSGPAATKAQSADLATLMSPSLNAGVPFFSKDGGNDMAIWQVAPGMTVAGGINIYRKKTRSISLSVRQAR